MSITLSDFLDLARRLEACGRTAPIEHREMLRNAIVDLAMALLEEDPFSPARPDSAAIEAAKATLSRFTVTDLRTVYPMMWIRPEDISVAERVCCLYGGKAIQDVMAYLCNQSRRQPPGKRRIFLSMLQDELAKRYDLTPDDYRRAGMPVPEDCKEPSCP